jgi:TPR repeat protein
VETELNKNLIKAKGLLTKNNFKQSLDTALISAGKGHTESQVFVGWLYLNGEGDIKQNIEESTKWLKIPAKSGNRVGHYLLGISFYLASKYDKALTEFISASKMDYFAADYQIGKMFYFGIGVQKDIEKAYQYFSVAKKQGHVFASRQVSIILMKGHKGYLNIIKGFFLFLVTPVNGFIIALQEPDSEKLYE